MVAIARTGINEVRVARAWLTAAAEPGAAALWEFIEAEGPVEAARMVRSSAGRGTGLLGRPALAPVEARPVPDTAEQDLDRIHQLGGRLVTPEDPEWPRKAFAPLEAATVAGQRDLAPPLALWVRGRARLDEVLARAVTVIGSRSATPYGEHVASDFGYELANAGWTIVSGGAYGIDSAALRGASASGGRSVAVLPAGLAQLYPSGNTRLFDAVADAGLLIASGRRASPPPAAGSSCATGCWPASAGRPSSSRPGSGPGRWPPPATPPTWSGQSLPCPVRSPRQSPPARTSSSATAPAWLPAQPTCSPY